MSIVPSYHTFMLPLLKVMSGGKKITTKQMRVKWWKILGWSKFLDDTSLPFCSSTACETNDNTQCGSGNPQKQVCWMSGIWMYCYSIVVA